MNNMEKLCINCKYFVYRRPGFVEPIGYQGCCHPKNRSMVDGSLLKEAPILRYGYSDCGTKGIWFEQKEEIKIKPKKSFWRALLGLK